MSEEIKEILNDLKKTADNCVFMVFKSQEELDQMPRYTSNFMSINDRQAKILLKYIEDLQQKVEQLENIRKEAIEYLTSYESISTIQGLNDIEKNKILDEKTMNEMVNRYLKVHDILLNILNKGSESNV